MPTPTDDTPRLAKTPSSVLSTKPQARLQKRNFDTLVDQKGYPIIIEKAIKCPCSTIGNQPRPTCRNCGGGGWLWVNPTQTKAIIQSMNKDTEYKEWSAENMGTASITTYHEVELGYMDKVTLREGSVSFSEVVKPKVYDDGTLRAYLTYTPIKIEAIFRFDDSQVPLVGLSIPTDVTLQGNILVIDSSLNALQNLTISVRYQHNPVFAVLDIPRSTIASESLHHNTKAKDHYQFPVHAVGKVFHKMPNQTSVDGTYLFDNSFVPECAETISATVNGQAVIINVYDQGEIDGLNATTGLIVFNSTTGCFQGWDGTEWTEFSKGLFWTTENW